MVSIIIPTYNRASTLERCIKSLLEQTYSDFEIIIVDDNSSDNSEAIIKKISDLRIKYLRHEKNLGANAARNTGIKHAVGELIAFQDSDDEWFKNKLEIQIRELNKSGADIVASSFIRYMEGKKQVLPKENINDEELSRRILYKNYISTQTILGKANCFKDNEFDKDLPRFQDWELMIRLSRKYRIHFIKQPLVNVYVQKDSITKQPQKAIDAINIIMKKYKEIINKDNRALAAFNSLLGDIYLQMEDFSKCYYYESLKHNKINYKTYIRLIIYIIKKIQFNISSMKV